MECCDAENESVTNGDCVSDDSGNLDKFNFSLSPIIYTLDTGCLTVVTVQNAPASETCNAGMSKKGWCANPAVISGKR